MSLGTIVPLLLCLAMHQPQRGVLGQLQMLPQLGGEVACNQAKPNASEGELPVSKSGMMSNAQY